MLRRRGSSIQKFGFINGVDNVNWRPYGHSKSFFSLFYFFLVSKKTVVLRRRGSSIQKFGFINGVDNVNWRPYGDSKSFFSLFYFFF